MNAHHRRWISQRLQFYLSLKKGSMCKKCGEDDPICLDFHHREPADKISTVREMALTKADNEKVLAEMAKCTILCANCHRKEHSYGY